MKAARQAHSFDLYANSNPKFTKWIVESGALREKFVIIDVGVRGGESTRFRFLGDHLVVHGFDAAYEEIRRLQMANDELIGERTYHWLAIGDKDGQATYFFDPLNPASSSLIKGAERQVESRLVPVRTLDRLLEEGTIPSGDFLKVDVEGFEPEVFSGAQRFLSTGILGVECESNFNTSKVLPQSHFDFVHEQLLRKGLRLCDLNFDRSVSPKYAAANARYAAGSRLITAGIGRPSTCNVLFCRSLAAERGGLEFYEENPPQLSVDQIIKTMIIQELYGLSDLAVETATAYREELAGRVDVDEALYLLCV
jgi:FkbM family methyltransferase